MAGTPANADNINASAGVMSWDGVATINTSAITQYDILVGGASNAIGNISPSTSSYVLTSNGTSANPSFQVLPSTLAISYVAIQTITANGPYTPTSGMKYCIVELLGGGGGGGGASATNSSQVSCGGGGGAGEYARGIFDAAAIGVSQSVIIGAKGTGSAGADGSSGGPSSFGTIMSAFGGIFGKNSGGSGTTRNGAAGLGGTGGSGGSFRSAGSPGMPSTGTTGTFTVALCGNGANSQYGAGGSGPQAGASGAGGDALGYGAGGSGAFNYISQSAVAGGSGTSGIAIVTEYI